MIILPHNEKDAKIVITISANHTIRVESKIPPKLFTPALGSKRLR
jgi:hypothetical protein